MTELYELHTNKIKPSELILKVTKAISGKLAGKFLIGLFYKRGNYFYCFSVPGNENERNWSKSPNKAIEYWKANNPGDSREINNPYLI